MFFLQLRDFFKKTSYRNKYLCWWLSRAVETAIALRNLRKNTT